ncbi:MAG: hypothetical protein ABJO27_07355 [Pseudoruegeria sp.]
MQSFERTCDIYLLYPRFSPQALSLHLTFSAFYTFLAIAASWGIYGISGFGAVELLPTDTVALSDGDSRSGLNMGVLVENRLFVLSAIAAVVMIFLVGALIASTQLGKDLVARILKALRGNDIPFAAVISVVSAVSLHASGMDAPFCALFALMMTLSIVLAGRAQRSTLVAAVYPVSFFANIFLIAILAAYFGKMSGAGGVLPILSLLCLLIGASPREGNASIIAGFVTLLASLILAALNFFVFEGTWFLIEPWDPGTFLVFLVIPIANGFWDWISMSITRQLTSSAISLTKGCSNRDAIRLYIAFVMIDILVAFLTIIFLYISLRSGFELYNLISGESASLDDYYSGFQEGLTTEHALLVIIMLVTVLLPSILHVHMVGRAWITQSGVQAVLPTLAYVTAMIVAIAALLEIARGVLWLLYPITGI